MPRTSTIVLALSVVLGLTVGTTASYSVEAREAQPSSTAAATTTATAERGVCARHYRNRTTKFGVNLSTVRTPTREAAAVDAATFGAPRVVRTWDTHGEFKSSWREQTQGLPRRTALVLSFRYSPQEVIAGQWDNQIAGFFKRAPHRRLVFWNFFHEPETEVLANQFTAAQFRQAFRHVADIAAGYCRPNLIPTLVLMGWTADPRSGSGSSGHWESWRSFFPGKRYVSVVAWDPYNSATVVPHEYRAPRDLYRYTVRASRSVHKRWGIAETGSAVIAGDNGSGRARWLHKVARYSRHHNAAFVTYFNSVGRVNDFRLMDGPSRRTWRAEMNR